MAAVIVTPNPDGGESTPDEEVDVWESVLSEIQSTNQLLRELVARMEAQQTNQTQITSIAESLLQTNSQLTAQLQAMPVAMVEAITPLLTPPAPPITILETPLSDTLPVDGGEIALPEAGVEPEGNNEAQPVTRRKFRTL